MTDSTRAFPEGSDFLDAASRSEKACLIETDQKMSEPDRQLLEEIGTVLSLLYRFATCHWGCKGQGHGIESLAGRVVTTSRSALQLISYGYYDESMGLIRGIGELANLLYLFMLSSGTLQEWYSLSDQDRWNKFRPKKVVQKIKASGSPPPVDEELYERLCKVGVHAHPEVRPQTHNKEKQAHLGAVFQPEGHGEAVLALGWCLFIAFGVFAKNANIDDVYKEQMKSSWIRLGKLLDSHPRLISRSA